MHGMVCTNEWLCTLRKVITHGGIRRFAFAHTKGKRNPRTVIQASLQNVGSSKMFYCANLCNNPVFIVERVHRAGSYNRITWHNAIPISLHFSQETQTSRNVMQIKQGVLDDATDCILSVLPSKILEEEKAPPERYREMVFSIFFLFSKHNSRRVFYVFSYETRISPLCFSFDPRLSSSYSATRWGGNKGMERRE